MCLILRSPRCVRCYDSQPGDVAATFLLWPDRRMCQRWTPYQTPHASGGKTFSEGQYRGCLRCRRHRIGGVGRSFDDPTYLCRRNSRQGRNLRSSRRCRLHWLSRRRTDWAVRKVHGHPSRRAICANYLQSLDLNVKFYGPRSIPWTGVAT